MTRTREEHLQWCKDRALEYLNRGDIKNAVTSMMSDLNKHPETETSGVLVQLGMFYILENDHAGAQRWIEGFR